MPTPSSESELPRVTLEVHADQIQAIKKRAPPIVQGIYIQAEQTMEVCAGLFTENVHLIRDELGEDRVAELERQRIMYADIMVVIISHLSPLIA
jgi:hypothetical protein